MKIAVVTPYFPTTAEPHRGHSAYQTLRFQWLRPRGFRYHSTDLDYRLRK